MASIKKLDPINLTAKDIMELEKLATSPEIKPRVQKRCKIILERASGSTTTQTAAHLNVTTAQVRRWHKRFLKDGIACLFDTPHGGRPGHPMYQNLPEITDADRQELKRLSTRRKVNRDLATRAQIILMATAGMKNRDIATQLQVTPTTVRKWRLRFHEQGLEGLLDEPRPGAPRSIPDDDIERVITKTLETLPENATHWSTRLMAQNIGMSQTAISRIWRAFGLQPHRVETFKLSNDPYFIEKIRDLVGIYLNPPERAAVFCVDEKSQIQALDRTQPLLPMTPGVVERQTHNYIRHGTTTLFAALNYKTGEVIGKCYTQHRSVEFRKFLDLIDKSVPEELDIHLILDNYGTHKAALIQRWLLKRPRFQMHFTPTYASWTNLVERWFAEITQKQIRRGSYRSVKKLEETITKWIENYNKDPKPYVWTRTADEILESVSKVCKRISDSGH
ncbi:IS630 family transposase [candidate division CSSED10-310 bacterium]|uniref:IS630 family transposase n=1 Tax=candidate division CSSED10-310 bacterium TaxID=2855610 RepID=A0ABV6YZ28_UNCC1